MKKGITLLLSLAMILSLAACSSNGTATEAPSTAAQTTAEAQTTEPEAAQPTGVFTGTANGRNGAVTVEVTLDEKGIADVQVVSSDETPNIGSVAVDTMAARVVEMQSVAIDTMSGATLSSYAVLNAVRDALQSAGADVSIYENKTEAVSGQIIEAAADVVVVGGGGAGLAAAVSALQSGAESVIIVEKTDILGGDTNVNGGIYNTPDSELQSKTAMTDGCRALVQAAIAEQPVNDLHAQLIDQLKTDYAAYNESGETGIFDSAAWYALQTWNGGDKVANLELVKNLAYNAYAGYEWLESLGASFKSEISQGPGSLYPRTHDTQSGLGAEFINTYIAYLEKNYSGRFQIFYGAAADGLGVNEEGVCNTVTAADRYDNTYIFTANNGIVLATGGFAGNVDMRVEYCQSEKWPNLGSDVNTTGVASDTGDGILMAQAIGANLVDMDQIQLLHMCNPKNGTTDDNSAKDKGVSSIIFVNQEGNRFVAEDGRRDTICLAVLEQTDAIFYAIESWDGNGDATLDELVTNNGVSYTEEIARGNMFIGETLEDLAQAIGADPENLKAAVEAYNACVDSGATSDEFGRNTFVEKLENGPYLAVPRKPSAHHTMGGVEITVNAEVLNTDGEIIPGLYAAGEVTGGIHGGNRLGGNAIVDTVVMGKIAGENAANFHKN